MCTVTEIVDLFSLVPSVIWSGVIAAFIALAGVKLSNDGNNTRLKTQLENDAEQKATERMSNLRREVYLQVVEDIAATNLHLACLSSRDLLNFDINKEILVISASLAKVKLVGRNKTASRASHVGTRFGVFVTDTIPLLVPIMGAKYDAEQADAECSDAQNKFDNIANEIASLEKAEGDKGFNYDRLKMELEQVGKDVAAFAAKRLSAYSKRNMLLKDFNGFIISEMKDLMNLQGELLVDMREDLGVETDKLEFRRQLELQRAIMDAQYKKSTEALENDLGL